MRKRVSVMQLPVLKRRRIGGIGGRQRLVPARNARVAATCRCLLCLTRRRHGQAKSSKAVNAGCLHEHTCLRRESLLNCPPQGRHVTSTLQCTGVHMWRCQYGLSKESIPKNIPHLFTLKNNSSQHQVGQQFMKNEWVSFSTFFFLSLL